MFVNYRYIEIFKLLIVMNFLQIRFGHLKLTSATPGLSNPCKLRFKSNIAGAFVSDIYRVVGDTSGFKIDKNLWYIAVKRNKI